METRKSPVGQREILTSGPRGAPLSGRIWSGRTRRELADQYLRYVYEHGVLEIERRPGCVGAQQFRRVDGDVAGFQTISYSESMDAIEATHGDGGDVRRVAHLVKDPECLLELPEFVQITELYVNDWQLGA